MILQNAGQLLHCHICNSRTDCFESSVAGCKNSEIFGTVYCVHEIGACQSSGYSAEAGCDSSGRNILRNGKDSVDYMDDATSKVNVLVSSSISNYVYVIDL